MATTFYATLSAAAPLASSTDTNQPAQFNQAFTSPLIDRACDWQTAIIRFTAQGMDLPLHIVPIDPAQAPDGTDPTTIKTLYQVRVGYMTRTGVGGTAGTYQAGTAVDVMWRPQLYGTGASGNVVSPPVTAMGADDYRTWVWTYDALLTCINKAIQTAYAAAVLAGFGGAVANAQGPVFTAYSTSPASFQCTMPLGFTPGRGSTLTTASSATAVEMFLWLSPSLAPLLEGFPVRARSSDGWICIAPEYAAIMGGAATGVNAQYPANTDLPPIPATSSAGLVNSVAWANPAIAASGIEARFVMKQATGSGDNWCPISEVAFFSTMPIIPESTAPPTILTTGKTGTGSASSSYTSIISDLDLPLALGATDWRSKVTYAPDAQYRWLDFGTTAASIQNISWLMLWRERLTGVLRPVLIRPGGSVQMKLVFRRKY